jgi:hypothetical protein
MFERVSPPLRLPQTILHKQVLHHYLTAQEQFWGTDTASSIIVPVLRVSYRIMRLIIMNSPEPTTSSTYHLYNMQEQVDYMAKGHFSVNPKMKNWSKAERDAYYIWQRAGAKVYSIIDQVLGPAVQSR